MFICKRVEVVDREGWAKVLPVPEKPLLKIGSAPDCDIPLRVERGAGALPVHLQVIASVQQGASRLVNLGDLDLPLSGTLNQMLSRRGSVVLQNGVCVRLGEYSLTFLGEERQVSSSVVQVLASNAPAAAELTPKRLGIQVLINRTRLEPGGVLEGVIRLSNLGDRVTQVNLDLDGFEPDCYDIEPGPLLHPHDQKEIQFHIYHRQHKPPAGTHLLTIRADAPQTYPGEEISTNFTVEILPHFQHSLRIGAQPEPKPVSGLVPSAPSLVQEKTPSLTQPVDQPPAAQPVAISASVPPQDGRTDLSPLDIPATPPESTISAGTSVELADAVKSEALPAVSPPPEIVPFRKPTPVDSPDKPAPSAPASPAWQPEPTATTPAPAWQVPEPPPPPRPVIRLRASRAPAPPPVDQTNEPPAAAPSNADWWSDASPPALPTRDNHDRK
ncbi:MAG TPA: hypothetical protein VIO61_07255 [Anaerolineaceae bacterium]